MKIMNIPTNYDALKVIQAHSEEVDFVLRAFLSNFDDKDRQTFLCLYAQLELDFVLN